MEQTMIQSEEHSQVSSLKSRITHPEAPSSPLPHPHLATATQHSAHLLASFSPFQRQLAALQARQQALRGTAARIYPAEGPLITPQRGVGAFGSRSFEPVLLKY